MYELNIDLWSFLCKKHGGCVCYKFVKWYWHFYLVVKVLTPIWWKFSKSFFTESRDCAAVAAVSHSCFLSGQTACTLKRVIHLYKTVTTSWRLSLVQQSNWRSLYMHTCPKSSTRNYFNSLPSLKPCYNLQIAPWEYSLTQTGHWPHTTCCIRYAQETMKHNRQDCCALKALQKNLLLSNISIINTQRGDIEKMKKTETFHYLHKVKKKRTNTHKYWDGKVLVKS